MANFGTSFYVRINGMLHIMPRSGDRTTACGIERSGAKRTRPQLVGRIVDHRTNTCQACLPGSAEAGRKLLG